MMSRLGDLSSFCKISSIQRCLRLFGLAEDGEAIRLMA